MRSHLGRNEHLPLLGLPHNCQQPQRIRPPPTRRHVPNPSRRRPRTHRPRIPLLRTPQHRRQRTTHQLEPRRPRPHRMTTRRLAALPRTHAGGHRPSEHTNRTFGTVTAHARTERSDHPPRARSKRLPAFPRTGEVNVLFDHRAREEGTQPCQTASEMTYPRSLTTSHSTTPTAAKGGSVKTSTADQSPAFDAGRTSPTPPRFTASGDLSAQAHMHEVTR